VTPAQVEAQARRRYNSVSDTTFYTQDEMFQWIWEAEQELATRTLCIDGRDTSLSTTASTQTYAIPTGFFEIKRVEYDGTKLQQIDFREDDALTIGGANTTSTGTPAYYFIWNGTLYLRPIPAESSKQIKIYGPKSATVLTTGSSSLSTPAQYHYRLIPYVTAQMAFKDENYTAYETMMDTWNANVLLTERDERRRKRADRFAIVKPEELMDQSPFGGV
jgi:hypothetical protein